MTPPTSTNPRKTPRQQRSRETVERILEAAAHIFNERGYTEATTNEIADEADVSIGSLYQYFPNKDALLLALAHKHIQATTTALALTLNELANETDFESIIRHVVNFLVDQHQLDDLHLLVVHEAPRTFELNRELDRARSQLTDAAATLLQSKIKNQKRRELIARMVVAIIDASVHDVILRQPKGKARNDAIELTIVTALDVIYSA